MAIANLAVRFLLELIGIVFVAIWASTLAEGPGALLLAGLAAGAFAVGWGRFLAPSATSGLTRTRKGLGGTVALLGAGASIAAAGSPSVAVVYAAAVLVNEAVLLALGDAADRAVAGLGRGAER
jgi:hypothetical protein